MIRIFNKPIRNRNFEVRKLRPRSVPLSYIDIIGPPGAGKSTLIDLLAQRKGFSKTAEPSADAIRTAGASLALFHLLIDHPGFLAIVAEAVQDTHEADTLLEFLCSTIHIYQWADDLEGRLGLFDEGFVCRAISLFTFGTGPLNEDRLRAYFRLISLPAYLISLRLPPEICLQQIVQKPRGSPCRMRPVNSDERGIYSKKRTESPQLLRRRCAFSACRLLPAGRRVICRN